MAQTDRGSRLRELLVDLQPPRFERRIDMCAVLFISFAFVLIFGGGAAMWRSLG